MEQVKRLLAMLTPQQRWTLLIAAVVVGGGIFGLTRWQREAGFSPLYTALAQDDAGPIVQKLKEAGVAYRLSADGSTVSVPRERAPELRLEMAAAGYPKSGRIGFEIFDKTNFGMTDFAEHVNYRRALEGELERSIIALSQVEQARVHISFPQESVFTESRRPAKASVLIKLRAGARLPETAVPSITHLVSSAVEGLAPESVSVLDMRGNLLSRAKRAGDHNQEMSEVAMEYRQKMERDLTAKLQTTLEPTIGAGRFRATVSADCDMTSGDQSEENFDPTHSVMTTSQKTEDVSSPSRLASGVPGVAANMPDAPARSTASGGEVSRRTENVNYQSSRTVKHTVVPQGALKRLSVAILMDQDVHFEGKGPSAKRVLTAPTPERIKVIHDLAAAAIGLDTERGDQLIVESLPFESTLNLESPEAAPTSMPAAPTASPNPIEMFKKNPQLVGGIAAGVVTVLGVGVFFVMRKRQAKPTVRAEERTASLPASPAKAYAEPADSFLPVSQAAQASQNNGSAAALSLLSPPRTDVLAGQVREIVVNDAEICVGVLRGWLRQEQN